MKIEIIRAIIVTIMLLSLLISYGIYAIIQVIKIKKNKIRLP